MKPKILICDIDWVLADNTHRLYPQNAVSYEDSFSRVSEDTETKHLDFIQYIIDMCEVPSDKRVVFLTGRSISCVEDTQVWLLKHVRSYRDMLIMRPIWDKRPSVDFKEEETKKLMEDYDIVLAIDDDIKIIEMYRRLGLNTLHINNA